MTSRQRPSWRTTLKDPTVVAVCLYGLVAMAAAVAAYFALFTQFAPYDDEGTLLVTLKAFAHGGTLYSDIYRPTVPSTTSCSAASSHSRERRSPPT